MTTVRVRELCKRVHHKNPISGHEWTTQGPTTGHEVVGKCGTHAVFKSEDKANKEAKLLQDFYDKFGL